ncbi:transmembrane protein [Thalictrum thalictroides]|uniref:Transmembrane protein n=1 Tax=Thalictrum thalictroides TaxID=46969 RepID=A0A7J6W5R7_THATH|nr:transmembrane protein [Thalictrum thalictroides]
MIKKHQTRNNFTYDWVVRTRVDGYWNAPLDPENFIPGYYLIPPGSNFGGLNDRLGIGDMNASTVALSRLSLIPELDSYGFTSLNSEAAFKAQLKTQGVKYHANRLPFCILSDRQYSFPPTHSGVPVASLSSPGPLSGTKCRPCKPVCVGSCVGNVMQTLYKGHGWTNWENGAIELCDAHDEWETGWEKIFDQVAGTKFASVRRHIKSLELTECIKDFEEMRRRTVDWDSASATEICRLGLGS